MLKFAVIIARHNGKWVFCKHKERNTWEAPGGHREDGEDILETAKRELYEETGAITFDITPICIYSVTAPDNFDGKKAYRRSIKIGRQNPQYYEVLEGLEAGEKVIVSSYESYKDNEVLVLE